MPDAALGRDIVAAADSVETQALKDVERLLNAAPLRSAQLVGPGNERVTPHHCMRRCGTSSHCLCAATPCRSCLCIRR